ncbi:MAG: MmgE/PrpD family protein [Oscillospiraceae bacterium]|nr:MmgE/PrpD family protein [Oscillospiraceae bacterium]
MNFKTDYKLENFILNIKWEKLPSEVQNRLIGCFVDLMGALVCGSRSEQFKAGVRLAERVYKSGEIAVIGSDKKFDFMGASAAMGHSSNAYDIDDGHNMTRAHPGTSFMGAVLAAAYEKNISRNEFLEAMLAAYETSIRSGAAIMDYYKYAHSSGTFGAVGVAAGVGRIYSFSKEELNNVLSIAEFNAPLVPGIRSVEYPSMNKDGVPFGVMVGALAITEALCGFEGNKNLLEADDYRHYLDDLGEKYQVMDLYFKPYPCCRWAHPAIDACTSLMRQNALKYTDVEHITIKTFNRATRLSKIEPKTVDEAQYNIAYPVASAVVYGDFGISQVQKEALNDEKTLAMMRRLSFETDERLDAEFPARRICRAEILTKDGRLLVSDECEPRGEAKENISVAWLCEKFERITAPFLSKEGQAAILSLITSEKDLPIRQIVDSANDKKFWIG